MGQHVTRTVGRKAPLRPLLCASAAGWQLKRLPVLIMLHGSGVGGTYIISHYRALADKYK